MLICNLLGGGGNRSCAKNGKIFVFSAKNRNFADALSEKSEGPIKRTLKRPSILPYLRHAGGALAWLDFGLEVTYESLSNKHKH